MKVFTLSRFAAALLGAALFFFTGCTGEEPTPEPQCQSLAECFADNNGDSTNNDGKADGVNNNGDSTVCGQLNVDVNNGDNNEDSCNNDVPECNADTDCAETEICGDGTCINECNDVDCGDFACSDGGVCVDPCAEWRWVRPDERDWHCPDARDENIGLYLEAREDGCYMGADLIFNGYYLPEESTFFYPNEDRIHIEDPPFSFDCVPM